MNLSAAVEINSSTMPHVHAEVDAAVNPAVVNLLDFDRAALRDFFVSIGEKPFHGDQVLKWLHQTGVTDVSQMTNLPKSLREYLQANTVIKLPEIAWEQTARDGTRKWLLRLADGNSIETVFIPEKERGTLCVSSQVGCALNCTFCSTATQGFSRNLSVAEIIGQLWVATRQLASDGTTRTSPITNVVFMGMGEPLLNFDAVVSAMALMMEDLAYNLSKYRVTLSSSGMVPQLKQLRLVSDVALAISLHAPTDELRNQLVPLNKKFPLRELIPVCREYFAGSSKRCVTFEYVMLKDVNDTPECARQLIHLLRDVPCKINLIPFNPFPGAHYVCSTPETIKNFQTRLQNGGFNVIVRRTRGEDIDAACGQLVGAFTDRTQRRSRWEQKNRIIPIKVED